MAGPEDWPKGRASALFMFVVLCGINVVLSTTHWLSNLYISLAPLYAWETLFFIFTFLALLCFVALKNNTNHVIGYVEERDEQTHSEIELTSSTDNTCMSQINEPRWTKLPFRHLLIICCCIGTISLPVFEAYRTIDNMTCFRVESTGLSALFILKCLSNVLCSLVCICVVVFLLRFKKYSSKSSEMKVLMSAPAALHFLLLVKVIIYIIWTSETMEENTNKPPNNTSKIPFYVNMSESDMAKELIFFKCKNNTAFVDTLATYFYKYSYQFPVEFALLSFCYLGQIWNVLPQRKRSVDTRQNDHGIEGIPARGENNDLNTIGSEEQTHSAHESLIDSTIPARWRRLRLACKSTFIFCCSHVFIPTSLIVLGIFALHLYTEIVDDTFDDENVILQCNQSNYTCIASANSIVQTVYIYVISIVAFIGFMIARKERKVFDLFYAIDILLLIAAGGRLLMILFETIDNVEVIIENKPNNATDEKVLFTFKTFCRYIGLYSQTILVLKMSKIKVCPASMKTGKQLLIKGIIIFLGVCNMEIWIADSFLEPTVLQYNENTKYGQAYGRKNWFFMTQLLYPFLTFYRLLTAIMCFEACVRFKRKLVQEDSVFGSSEQHALA